MRTLAIGALAVLTCLTAQAQVLIDPVVVELGSRQRSASITLTLSPQAAAPLRLQAEVLQWQQDERGQSQFEPSRDLLVVPPIVELQPGESQLVRVAFRGARSGPHEQAYRLLLEDPGTGSTNAGLSFRMRYDLPVMVGAAEPLRSALRWSSCTAEPGKVCVRLDNDGNRRVTLRELTLAGEGWSLPLAQPGTVLARSGREWQLPRPANARGTVTAVQGHTMRDEPVHARLVQ
jgi:fimbrial chaperone protein